MFGRRKRAASNPHVTVNVNPSATTAAAQAFLARTKSDAALSAAAAATALRSRPTTPTNVAEVQTKRTMRRTNSGSSRASSVPARPSSQLERRPSSGSMSERTFRDPSPARGAPRPSDADAPPVPTIPRDLVERASPTLVKRASSVQVAPMRISSPPVNPGTGRGYSMQPTLRMQQQTRSGPRGTSTSNIRELTSVDRSSSRGSVNFSLPTSLRRSSSTAQWMLTPRQSSNQNRDELVYDPNTRTLRTRADMLFYEQGLREASQKPVMRRRSMRQGQGSHLAEGSVGGRLKGTAVDGGQRRSVYERQIQEATQDVLGGDFPRSQRVASPRNSIRDSSTASDNDSETSERPMKYSNRVGQHPLSNKPSMVREERQREEDEDDSVKVLGRQATLRKLESANQDERDISPTPFPRTEPRKVQNHIEDGPRQTKQAQPPIRVESTLHHQSKTATVQEGASEPEAPTPLPQLDIAASATKSPLIEKLEVERAHSLSPTRAHFLSTPSPISQFSIRHEPPARSISPRKSALKPSPSPRGPSPMGYNAAGWAAGPSQGEVSDASTSQSDDRLVPKKKSVRVSFDERNNVVVGEEPVLPESSRTWTSSYIRGKKAISPVDDVPDEIMGPRPVLPSFGSVRKKEPRDIEDRPLVKPSTLQVVSPAISTSNSGSDYFVGQSADHAVGSILNQDQASKAARSSANSRDPLPPEVTSVEGSGYVSDSGSSAHSLEVEKAVVVPIISNEGDASTPVKDARKPNVVEGPIAISEVKSSGEIFVPGQLEGSPTVSDAVKDGVAAHDFKANENGNAPKLMVTQPTPIPGQGEWQPQIPGGLAENSWELENATEIPFKDYIAEKKPTGLSAAGVVLTQDGRPGSPDTESSDGESIYSDAAEEFSDDGQGFMSLDAFLKSSGGNAENGKEISSKVVDTTKSPNTSEGWDDSQRFWSGLSADKRRQMELDALLEKEEEREGPTDELPSLNSQKQRSHMKVAAAAAPDRTYQIIPGAKAGPDGIPSMRTSMRASKTSQQEDGRMRMSMRNNTTGSMRSNASNHFNEPKRLRAGGAVTTMQANTTKPAPTLRRSASVESDSSFVRERPRKEGYQMKRSMRGSYSRETPTLRNSNPPVVMASQSSRFSIRALSPSRKLSINSSTRPTPTLRFAPDESPKSPRRLFSRSKPTPAPQALKPASRFADSSDEEDDRPARTFRSRFADSSDEEDNVPPAPLAGSSRGAPQGLRPIPRFGIADGDSSDLPDSDDSTPFAQAAGVSPAALRLARANFQSGTNSGSWPIGNIGNTTGVSAADFREAPRKKGGLMSILRRKKPDQPGRIQRTDWGESGARRDTPLERSRVDLEIVKARDAAARGQQSPRLQKKTGSSRTVSWQAAPTVIDASRQADGRPATSDGVVVDGGAGKVNGSGGEVITNGAATAKPGILRRNNTVESVEFVGVGEGKKKKFGRLRRLFNN